MEKLLKKANRDTNMRINMARHYYARNMVCKVRVKNMKKKLKRAIRKLKKRDNLELLVDASFVV